MDAPCSGTGTLRRAPDLGARLSAAEISRFPALQSALVAEASRLVKPGGAVVYATCSLLPDENEAVIENVLASHDSLESRPVAVLGGYAGDAGRPFGAWRRTLLPSREGSDGFFIANLRRRD